MVATVVSAVVVLALGGIGIYSFGELAYGMMRGMNK